MILLIIVCLLLYHPFWYSSWHGTLYSADGGLTLTFGIDGNGYLILSMCQLAFAAPTSMQNHSDRLYDWCMASRLIDCCVALGIPFALSLVFIRFGQRFSCCLIQRSMTLVSHSFRWERSRHHVSETAFIARLFSFSTFFSLFDDGTWARLNRSRFDWAFIAPRSIVFFYVEVL